MNPNPSLPPAHLSKSIFVAEQIEPRGPLSGLPPHPQSKNKVQCTELATLGIDSHEMKDMGSLGDGTAETEQNQRKSFSLGHDGDTQLLDSQQLWLPTSPAIDVDEMVGAVPADEHFPECTMPYDDTVPVDEFQTQIVNLEEEPQAANFDAETEIINSQGDCMDYLETQLLDEFATQAISGDESEETCRTEILGAGNYSSEDYSLSKSIGCSVDKKKMQFDSPCEKAENRQKADSLNGEFCVSGTPRGFTSIRTASVRASGLAAATASTNQLDSGSYNLLSRGRSLEETACKINGFSRIAVSSNFAEEVGQEQVVARLGGDLGEPRDGNKCKVGSSTVRRLFTEDANFETNNNFPDKGEEDLNIAGLSYIDSQEPGDLSQANALDFVEQFLKDNVDDLHQDFGVKTTAVGKSASVPKARGPQVLAANRATTIDNGIFDWDDNMEDEGGGDIFCRRKDDFFKGESMLKSWVQPRKKLQGSRLDESKHNEPLDPQEKTRGLVRSAPLVKFSARGETGDIRPMNLSDDFSAEPTGESLRGQTEEIFMVGFDTQLAAEAMQDLGQDKGLTEKDECEDEALQNPVENGRKKDLEPPSKCTRRFERRDESIAEPRKKSPISLTSSRCIRKCKQKTKVNLREKTLGQTRTDKLDISCPSIEMYNGILEEKLQEVGRTGSFFTPVARRTRLSKAVKESIRAESLPSNLHKETICVTENGAHQVKKIRSKRSAGLEGGVEPVPRYKRSRTDGTSADSGGKKKTRSSKRKMVIEGSSGQKSAEDSSTKSDRNPSMPAKNVEAEANVNESPLGRSELLRLACITPTSCLTPSNDASPVCAGNEYFKQSCRKSLSRTSLWKELKSLTASSFPEPSPASKDTRRKWRDMADVLVLYSHHLDEDTIKQQRKILARLGASEASSISDATHFVTDKFVRTRNMLEAIALGKPVVTHLWLESCAQASCFLDEKNYILRDAKKEKEIGFSMPSSLLRASQHPLLRDRRVLITVSTKPSKEIISSLVKAVGGQPTERIGRSALRDEKVPENLLILSCEEDYDICLPFLEKGAAVYSSELLLNGIVTQKLEYERHQLFVDSVKRTRRTVWLKDGKKFVPVVSKHDKPE